MSNGDTPALNACGCCQAESDFNTIDNRPGLSALSYRVGTYGLFFQRLLDQIHSYAIPDGPNAGSHPLASLTTRSQDDPAIALLDAWAVIADVLTFYEERIVNEGYLRTATERRSILELAREIGYELSPGVAASAYLQFTIEEVIGTTPAVNIPGIITQPPAGPGSSAFNAGVVDIPQGTQIQSIPAPGQVPQTFETSADFQARVEWNTLKPRQHRQQDIALVKGQLYLLGTSSTFPTGVAQNVSTDDIYLLNPQTALDLTATTYKPPPFYPGQILEETSFGRFSGIGQLKFNSLRSTAATGKRSAVHVSAPRTSAQMIPAVPVNFIYLQGTSTNLKTGDRLLLVGFHDTATQAMAFIVRSVDADTTANYTLVQFEDSVSIPPFVSASFPYTDLKVKNIPFNQDNVATYILSKTVTEGDLAAFMQMNNWNGEDLVTLVNNPPPPPPSQEGPYSFGTKAAFFGNNAPIFNSLPKVDYSRGDPYPGGDWDAANSNQGRTIWTDSQGGAYADASVFLERSFPQITTPGWVWLECPNITSTAYEVNGVVDKSLADYGLSGRSTGLSLNSDADPQHTLQFQFRKTTAWVQSQQLALAEMPVVDEILSGTTQLMLDDMVVGLTIGQPVVLGGSQADPPGVTASEILLLESVTHIAGFTVLAFTTGLQYSYIRSSVTMQANVTLATHGATVQEVLGSGDGSKTNQSFTLKRPPLTYVSAPTPNGIASTLQIRVNGLEWQESPTLYGLDASDQEYIVRLADDATPTVTFGDPAARLKTGQQNVAATYRTGIGLAGNVAANTLSLLQSRPPGLRGVTNPLAAGGGADPQNLSDARSNAPLTVLTLDRIVSLDDYQSFAQAFAGIGKAQAVAVWSGATRMIQITIAAANGASISATDPLYNTLVQAIELAHDPVQAFTIAGFEPLSFNLSAAILIDKPTYQPNVVIADALAALSSAFSFANRAFAQSVSAAEILELIQTIPGVIAVDLNQLYQTGDPNGPSQTEGAPFLPALPARFENGAIQPAQLLLLNPLAVTLTEMTS